MNHINTNIYGLVELTHEEQGIVNGGIALVSVLILVAVLAITAWAMFSEDVEWGDVDPGKPLFSEEALIPMYIQ